MKDKKILIIITAIILFIDQLTKFLILNLLDNSKILIPSLLEIEIIKNKGIAFGLNNGNLRNIIITIVILVVIIFVIKKQLKYINKNMLIFLGLILGGGLGNLVDRFLRGGVVDFIKVSTFPIFNIADIFIVIGSMLLIIYIFKFSINSENKEVKK